MAEAFRLTEWQARRVGEWAVEQAAKSPSPDKSFLRFIVLDDYVIESGIVTTTIKDLVTNETIDITDIEAW